MAAVGGAAPPAAAVAQSTETEWTAFLDQLRDEAEIDDFIENLGQDLVGSEILREAEFGKKPSMLQKSKLKTKLRGSKIFVGDIEADASWKNKKFAHWQRGGAAGRERAAGADQRYHYAYDGGGACALQPGGAVGAVAGKPAGGWSGG
jgi:hypothetical protein